MPVNATYIKEKFVFSKKYIDVLDEIKQVRPNEFYINFRLQLQAERLFEIISLIMLDICSHIVAHSNESPPETYADCMLKLHEMGILGEKESETYVQIIKMRNLITYRYGEIDNKLLFQGTKMLTKDFENFRKSVLNWIEKIEKSKG